MGAAHSTRHGNGFKDLTGTRFGMLVVISYSHTLKKESCWRCRCDCGNFHVVRRTNLKSGKTVSCGCYLRRVITKHGYSEKATARRTREYSSWLSMRKRCNDPGHSTYRQYGAVGITVCREWDESFQRFLADMGPAPTQRHTVDRIDNKQGYCPGNCRWATTGEQARNRGRNRKFTHGGETLCVTDWAARLKISVGTLRNRIKACGFERAVEQCESESWRRSAC